MFLGGPGPGALCLLVFFYLNKARRDVIAGGQSCRSPIFSLFPLPPLFFPAARAHGARLRPSFRSPGGLQGPGSSVSSGLREQLRLRLGRGPLPLSRWPSAPLKGD
eukprot:scaffold23364_cov22-Tisochrysis_lutea.AAC.1